jgi:hypothetical protein
MIRIDEIYNHTFWHWINKNIPLTRMFFCDPPGRADPDSLFNHGHDVTEVNYIFFHDQEPIHLDIHRLLFDDVDRRNLDLNHSQGPRHKAIITSERASDNVDQVCSHYNWRSYYYFFHGWAALDWYRGYDKTFLIKPSTERTIKNTFIAPNRIVAGKRQHRLEILYWIFKMGLTDNWISCPDMCPAENISIHNAVQSLRIHYHDIESVFAAQQLPMDFPGETGHPMHSCWLSLFDESAESLLYLVTETVATGRRHHLTEKTFKPIALGMPFVIVGTQGSLRYLRSYGFKTFGEFWDESYDDEPNDQLRIKKIANTLKQLNDLEPQHKDAIFHSAQEVIQHNWNHFYHGGFEAVLWQELQDMLQQIKQDFQC